MTGEDVLRGVAPPLFGNVRKCSHCFRVNDGVAKLRILEDAAANDASPR